MLLLAGPRAKILVPSKTAQEPLELHLVAVEMIMATSGRHLEQGSSPLTFLAITWMIDWGWSPDVRCEGSALGKETFRQNGDRKEEKEINTVSKGQPRDQDQRLSTNDNEGTRFCSWTERKIT